MCCSTKALVFAALLASSIHVSPLFAIKVDSEEPVWGCGLLGRVPGISSHGIVTSAATRKIIDGVKGSSSFGKVNYWNWDKAPKTDGNPPMPQYLSEDFIFMPTEWGMGPVNEDEVVMAGEKGFTDKDGSKSDAEMATVFMGANEPDMIGSCLGNMMGKCTGNCAKGEKTCPVASRYSQTLSEPNEHGHCNCWQKSDPTSVGFFDVAGCKKPQPLPDLFNDTACTKLIINNAKETARVAAKKGYRYLTTPMIAENMDWVTKWIEEACECTGKECKCTDISCGCPVYVAFHFYGRDCQPDHDEGSGGYGELRRKLDATAKLMETYPFIKGAIVNEVGMLNCAGTSTNGCIPNSGKYPATAGIDGACPIASPLVNGIASFMEKTMDMLTTAKTTDGRSVVKSISWYNEKMVGATYNLLLFTDEGQLTDLGEAYISACKKWADHQAESVLGVPHPGGNHEAALVLGVSHPDGSPHYSYSHNGPLILVVAMLAISAVGVGLLFWKKRRVRSQQLRTRSELVEMRPSICSSPEE